MRFLELFSGIGAVSCSVSKEHEIVCAIDINQSAMQVFRLPGDLETTQLYRLIGNSLSIPCVRYVLESFRG